VRKDRCSMPDVRCQMYGVRLTAYSDDLLYQTGVHRTSDIVHIFLPKTWRTSYI
jgi:hypothetical protein